jgi:hypothetical protein
MNIGRTVLTVTFLLVAGLGAWFAVARWDEANKVAAILSALGAVAAVGVAVWTALRSMQSGSSTTIQKTGHARADSGGDANTGLRGKSGRAPLSTRLKRTGDAEATDGGSANSGVHLE